MTTPENVLEMPHLQPDGVRHFEECAANVPHPTETPDTARDLPPQSFPVSGDRGCGIFMLQSGIAADLVGTDRGTISRRCRDGKYPGARRDEVDGGEGWLIPLSSLPPLAQARYLAKHLDLTPGYWSQEDARTLASEEAETLWARFEGSSEKLRTRAYQEAEACHAWLVLKNSGAHYQTALNQIKAEYGLAKSALYDKIGRIKGFASSLWPALLVGQWAGDNAKRAEWPPLAWDAFLKNAMTPGRKIKTAWSAAKRQAEQNGWGAIPSYDTAKKDFKALPQDVVTLVKQGETALKTKSPKLKRDYSVLPLHELWSMDGRRLDVMVIDRRGKYGKEGRVFRLWLYAYMDVRSRYVVGYAFGGTLDSDLVQGAFLNALKTTNRIIPRGVQPDNGTEIGAKAMTGAAPWRFRGKVKDDDIVGMFPLLDIAVHWATPAHGQAKPVERLFGTLAGKLETRPEFRGAYCGNKPDARPEEWDKKRAADVELVERLFAEELSAYHRTPHTGQGMDGLSPLQTYTAEMERPDFVARRITLAQLRICSYSAQAITIRKDGGFTILGAAYYSEGTAKLAPGRGYYARYNPGNLSDTVYVYRANKLLCEAQKIELTAFNDKAAAKGAMKRRATYIKSVKTTSKAYQGLSESDSQSYLQSLADKVIPEGVDPETGEILPGSKIMEMVKTRAEVPSQAESESELERKRLENEVKKMKEAAGRAYAESLRQKRALGGH